MINVELLDRTLDHIEAHPAGWDQRVYRCETGMCFAGWACELAGGRWVYDDDDVLFAEEADGAARWSEEGHKVVSARHRAARLLGLDDAQVNRLFDCHNTLGDLRRIVAELREAS